MSRWRYFAKRVLMSVPVLWLGMTATFSIIYLGPIDPAAVIAGSTSDRMTSAKYQNVREQLGLDEPLPQQYADYMVDLLTFDLGQSWVIYSGNDTWGLIATFAPRTVWLGLWSVVIAVFVGVPLGFYAGLNSNTTSDYASSLGGIVWRAMPNFWLAVILLAALGGSGGLLFGFEWSEFVVSTEMTGTPLDHDLSTPTGFFAAFKEVLPAALVLGSASMGNELRIGRTAVLETKNEQYVETAKAKEVSDRALVWKHIFRNALIPLVPVITSEAFLLIGGSVLVETVFGINGIGSLFFNAAINGDLPLVASLMYIFILLLLAINIFQDFLYTLIDPRVGYEEV